MHTKLDFFDAPLSADGWICAKGCVVSDSVTRISISGDEVERSSLKDNVFEFSRFTHCQMINLNGTRILGSLFHISGHGSLTVLKLAGNVSAQGINTASFSS